LHRLDRHEATGLAPWCVTDGKKPIAVVKEELAWLAANRYVETGYIKMKRIPKLAKRPPNMAKYAVYRYEEDFDAVSAAWDLYPYEDRGRKFDETTVKFDIALGLALGYTDTDIAHYLKHNYSFEVLKKGLANGKTESRDLSSDST